MLLAKVYRMRIEPPGEKPGPWCWYWTETDDLGESQGDGSEPFPTKDEAARAARAAGFEVTAPAPRRRTQH